MTSSFAARAREIAHGADAMCPVNVNAGGARHSIPCTMLTDKIDAALQAAHEEGRRSEREAWLGCAQYDPTMEGPAFKGWNRSALDRMRKEALAQRDTEAEDG